MIQVITLVNYKDYQEKGHQTKQQKDSRRTKEGQQKDIYKNVYNEENEKTFIGVLLSTSDVATQLNITTEKVRKLIQAGELPATKTGQQWIILEEDLINFIKPVESA